MKKIFAFLVSIWIPIYLLFGLLASCEKSSDVGDQLVSATSINSTAEVVGKWRLKEYFQDAGNGQGKWVTPDKIEEISFSTDGIFSANENFLLSEKNLDRYRILDSTRLELYSSRSNETITCVYKRESSTSLLFNPLCREKCTRRYELVN